MYLIVLSLACTVVLSVPLDKASASRSVPKMIDGNLMSVDKTSTPASPEMISAIVDSADKLSDVLIKIKDQFVGPAIDALDAEISKINTNIEGITQEEKDKVRDALESLYNSESSILAVRAVLEGLATETISRSSKLRAIISKIEDGASEDRIKKLISYSAKHMIDLMGRSKDLLDEAQTKYSETTASLNKVKADLVSFRNSVEGMADDSRPRMQAWIKKTREIVYGSGAACLVFPPSCAIYYPTAAAILETKINQYKEDVALLETVVKQSTEHTQEMIDRVDGTLTFVNEEVKLIIAWESQLSQMSLEFESADSLAFDIELLGKEGALEHLVKLEEAAQNYLDHHQ